MSMKVRNAPSVLAVVHLNFLVRKHVRGRELSVEWKAKQIVLAAINSKSMTAVLKLTNTQQGLGAVRVVNYVSPLKRREGTRF